MVSLPLSSNCTGSAAPCPAAPPMSWPTSTGPAPPTAPPKRSTADSNTSAAPPSASATSPTTSPDHSSKQAASAPPYTAKCDEPNYSLNAHSPWEGYRVAVNGTEGRAELEVVERGAAVEGAKVLDPSATAELGGRDRIRPRGERL